MKILVVGCGSIGRRHISNLVNMSETAVVDAVSQKAEKCAEEFGIRHFHDLTSALEWLPDGVVISTPHTTHLSVGNEIIKSIAFVLIEKPLSNSLEGVDSFLSAARQYGSSVYVVCNMRFHSGVKALHDNLPRIGKPLFARAYYGNFLPDMRPDADYRTLYCSSREQGGGVILDAIHELDYLSWFFGPVNRVTCEAGQLGDLDIDVEDYACLGLAHRNEVRSEIHLDYLQRVKRRGCEIVGSTGMLLWESEGKQPEKCHVRLYEINKRTWVDIYKNEDTDINLPYRTMMEGFVSIITGKSGYLLTADQAASTLSVALAAHTSAQQQRSIHMNGQIS